MRKDISAIPLSPSLNSTLTCSDKSLQKKPQLSGRVLFLSLQATTNAVIICILAKVLVLLIHPITNIAFYKQFSFQPSSPAGNSRGRMVIFVPVNTVCEIMGSTKMDVIAVLSKTGKNKIAGIIAADVLKVYSDIHKRDNHYYTSTSLQCRTMRLIIRGRILMQSKRTGADV